MSESKDESPLLETWLGIASKEPDSHPKAPILYHYTDAIGLHGIVTSGQLWASAAQFSNDLSEIEYAKTMACEIISELWPKDRPCANPWELCLREGLKNLFAAPEILRSFLVSFCEEKDLLSQWRGYGRRSGFSLAFKLEYEDDSLAVACKNSYRTLLKKVVYDADDQKKALRSILDRLAKTVASQSAMPTPEARRDLDLLILLELTEWASTVKHSAFSEEREWRLICFLATESPEVRATSELLTPYLVVETRGGGMLPLVEICCGPSPLQKESAIAVEILMKKVGRNVPVSYSTVPLRV